MACERYLIFLANNNEAAIESREQEAAKWRPAARRRKRLKPACCAADDDMTYRSRLSVSSHGESSAREEINIIEECLGAPVQHDHAKMKRNLYGVHYNKAHRRNKF